MLSCIWLVSKKPAQANCRGKARPVVWKRCKPKKCKKRKGELYIIIDLHCNK